jgi:hypothetical protein
LQNWARWEEEKPDWFHDNLKRVIPLDFMPEEFRGRGGRRRSSLSERILELQE